MHSTFFPLLFTFLVQFNIIVFFFVSIFSLSSGKRHQVSYDPRSYERNLCKIIVYIEAWKIQDFKGVWTRDLNTGATL